MTPFCGGSLAWPHDGDESERQVARVLEGSERKAGFKADPAGLDPHPRSTSVGPTSLRGTVDDVLNACRRDSSRRLRFPHAPCRNAKRPSAADRRRRAGASATSLRRTPPARDCFQDLGALGADDPYGDSGRVGLCHAERVLRREPDPQLAGLTDASLGDQGRGRRVHDPPPRPRRPKSGDH